MAKNRQIPMTVERQKNANRGNRSTFTGAETNGPPDRSGGPFHVATDWTLVGPDRLTERGDALGQAREFAARGVLVDDAAGNAASKLGLRLVERGAGIVLVTGFERCFDGLDESPDAAHSCAVDQGAVGIATDALLGLRRVRHSIFPNLSVKKESGANPMGRTGVRSP